MTRPVLVGPVTYLALAKADPATPDFDPLTRIDEAVAALTVVTSRLGSRCLLTLGSCLGA